MRKPLIAVDGSDHANRAVEYAIDLFKRYEPVEVHLINVQPAPVKWQTRGIGEKVSVAHARDHAREATAGACSLLKAAAIDYHLHLEMGEPAEVIARFTKKLKCDGIIMGTRGLGPVNCFILA